ncbi:MAG: sigma-70 family RNA polymerase sigma factor [Clostridia bacterium]|nr:sigma-70 family RNA polymerase sigma factor [Clostridia bacterium]
MKDYRNFTDEQLVALYQNDKAAGDALLERYKKAVKSAARQYYLIGGEEDDLIQEGTIGLFRAISTYSDKSSFRTYAFACIKSSIISAVRKDSCLKNSPLNGYVSIDAGEDKNPHIKGEIADPEEDYINFETAEEFIAKVKAILSGYEYGILTLYLNGYSYADIAEQNKVGVKSVDNAIQRIRKKIAKVKTDGRK